MKKFLMWGGVVLLVVLSIVTIIFIILIFSSPAANNKVITATDYANALKAAGFPIVNIIEYTEETDENKLLGRPGQYISKVNFGDSRIEQTSENDPQGGTVEVFTNKADMEKRNDYILNNAELFPAISQYVYKSPNGLALLRLEYDLTPSEAEQYKTAFEEFCKTGNINKVSIAGETVLQAPSSIPTQAAYSLNQEASIIVDNKTIGTLTINKITAMKERNKYSDKNPAQVILIEYTYSNISDVNNLYISGLDFEVIDSAGYMGDTYPNSVSKNPQSTPIGAKCNAQEVIGLDSESANITLNYKYNMFDSTPTIVFNIPIG